MALDLLASEFYRIGEKEEAAKTWLECCTLPNSTFLSCDLSGKAAVEAGADDIVIQAYLAGAQRGSVVSQEKLFTLAQQALSSNNKEKARRWLIALHGSAWDSAYRFQDRAFLMRGLTEGWMQARSKQAIKLYTKQCDLEFLGGTKALEFPAGRQSTRPTRTHMNAARSPVSR